MTARRLIATAAVGIACGLGLLACGGSGSQPPPEPQTELTVAVRPEGPGGPVERRRVSCTPDSTRPLCRKLRATARADFAPVPPEAICTAIYGGPATAAVDGRLRGRDLEAHFDLRNGCDIARWQRFAWLLGDPPALAPGHARHRDP